MVVKELSEIDLIFKEIKSEGLGAEVVEVDETVELGEVLSEFTKKEKVTFCWAASLGSFRGLLTLLEFKEKPYQLIKVDYNEDIETLGSWEAKEEALQRLCFELGKIIGGTAR